MQDDRSPAPARISRRAVLERAAYLTGTIAATSILASLAPSRAWALTLSTLTQPQSETILDFAQVLFPHKDLPTAVYALVAKDLDAKAAQDPKTAATIADGSLALDKAANGSFASAGPDAKLAAVKSIEGTPFFALVRGQCITSLYNNEMAFAHFGYEGASWPKGGYLHRGFNDLTWLANPPAAASPKPWA